MDNNYRRLLCVVEGDSELFPVEVPAEKNVFELKKLIRDEAFHAHSKVLTKDLVLCKVDVDMRTVDNDLSRFKINENGEKLTGWWFISDYWPEQPPSYCLHIIVKLRTSVQPPCFVNEDPGPTISTAMSRTPSEKRTRKWAVSGAIRDGDSCYRVDLETQTETRQCLDRILARQFVLLTGTRASGKTTRLFLIRSQLAKMGLRCLYISFEGLAYMHGITAFWDSFDSAATKGARRCGIPFSFPSTSTQRNFLETFHATAWSHRLVLLLDEFSELCRAPADVRNECLRAFREVRNNNSEYAVSSIVVAGTFDILHLNPTDLSSSPFNVSDHIQSPYFTIEETRSLFHEFALDNSITVEDDVIQDVWTKTNGHPVMVCLCGRIIANNVQSLLDNDTLSYLNWLRFPVLRLHQEMYAYNTFRSMVQSLLSTDAEHAVDLLRSDFIGFPGDVTVCDEDEDTADFLTSQGVLLKPDPVVPTYRMTSLLVDGLIQKKIIARKFRNAPSTEPPFKTSQDDT